MNLARAGLHPKIIFDRFANTFSKTKTNSRGVFGKSVETGKKWDIHGVRSSVFKKTGNLKLTKKGKQVISSKNINKEYDFKGNLSKKKVTKEKSIL